MSGVDTGDTYELILHADKDKDSPRVFVFKNMTCRQWKQAKAVWDVYVDSGEVDDALQCARLGLVDWRGVEFEGKDLLFNLDDLDIAVSDKGAIELPLKMLQMNGLSADQKKKLEQQWASGQDSSQAAESAEALESAKTSQP